jgi:DNA-binding phage protein
MKAFMGGRGFTLRRFEDFEVEEFRKNPGHAALRIEDELEEYLETKDPKYLLGELKTAVKAFGYHNFVEKTGLSRRTIHNIVSGRTTPKFEIVLKFLNALGFGLKLGLIKNTDNSPKEIDNREKKTVNA